MRAGSGVGPGSAVLLGPPPLLCRFRRPTRSCSELPMGGRTFSVNLEENVFCCFDRRCGQQGDVIDLWAALHQLDLRAAAVDLVQTFGLEPAPARGTEKRNG